MTRARDLADLGDSALGIESAWTAYTPTITNFTLGNGTVIARYKLIGKTLLLQCKIVFGSTSSISGSPIFYMPFSAKISNMQGTANILIQDFGTAYFKAMSADGAGGYFYIYAESANSTYVRDTGISSTVPMTWTTNDSLSMTLLTEVE
jgi:hypothetical protein